MAYEKNTRHKVVKGMSSFNFDFIFDSYLQLYRNRPRDLHRSGTIEMHASNSLPIG